MATLRAVVLLLVLVLAGCAAPGAKEARRGDDATDGGPAASRFLSPVDLSGRSGGPEPIVVVGDEGAVWVAAQDAAGGNLHVWVSTDGAKSFRASRPPGVRGGEVDIALGSGIAFVTQLGPGGNVVSYTRDKGATWQQSTFAGTNYFERELVAIDKAGSVYLASRFGLRSLTGSSQGDDATVARSDDGGITFSPAGRVWDAQHEPGTTIGNLVAHASSLSLAYNCRDNHGVCYATSHDRGMTWTQRLVAQRSVDAANTYPILAVSGSRMGIVWSDASDGRLAVWGATSTDGGATWGAPVKVSESAETATLPWVATGGGRTWVVYLSTDVQATDAGAPAAKDAQWRARGALVDAGLAVVERAWVLPDPVHAGVISKPLGRPGGSGPYDRSFGDFFTVAIDADGRAYVAVVRTLGGATQDLLVAER